MQRRVAYESVGEAAIVAAARAPREARQPRAAGRVRRTVKCTTPPTPRQPAAP